MNQSTPLQKHPQFTVLIDTLWRAQLAASALKGIGSLMTPQRLVANESLDATMRADAAAVFQFFGDTLFPNIEAALNAVDTLETVMRQNGLVYSTCEGEIA